MLSLTLDLPPDITEHEARLMLSLRLFEEHRISIGKAAEIAGFSKAAFMEVAGQHGIAVFDYPEGDLPWEMSL